VRRRGCDCLILTSGEAFPRDAIGGELICLNSFFQGETDGVGLWYIILISAGIGLQTSPHIDMPVMAKILIHV
jgi:hypothetical protein